MKRVSLDTPNEVLWADRNPLERIMQDRPTPVSKTAVLTSNGNMIQQVAR